MSGNIIDYHINANGIFERAAFYNYMHELGYKDEHNTKEEMINSEYPFAVCMKKKKLFVVESATICYMVQRAGKMKTVEEFKEIIENNK